MTDKSLEKNSKSELNNTQNSEKKEKESTILRYAKILDTVTYTRDLNIENTNHKLELKLYSLNDSSVIIESENLKEICHNNAIDILLTNKKDTILYKKLTKEIFKDSIDFNEYKFITLSGIGYDNIRSNRIYFNVNFDDANNFSCFPGYYYKKCDIGIFFRTNKKGKVSFQNFRSGRE